LIFFFVFRNLLYEPDSISLVIEEQVGKALDVVIVILGRIATQEHTPLPSNGNG